MENIIHLTETYLYYIVEICCVLMELFGIVVLVFTAIKCFVQWIRRDATHLRLDLAQGIALSLEFKMGSEVLRTVVVREWEELLILGAVILLRGLLTFLNHFNFIINNPIILLMKGLSNDFRMGRTEKRK